MTNVVLEKNIVENARYEVDNMTTNENLGEDQT
jgi:hypothetical protein